jgi:ribosome maturation factor RimP
MEQLRKNIQNWLSETLSSDQFVVELNILEKGGKKRILIILDGDHGITIDDCASISRQLGQYLEDHDLLDGALVLEVSSPG